MDLPATRGDYNVYEVTVKRNRQPVNLNAEGVTLQFAAKVNKSDLDADCVILKPLSITDGNGGLAEIVLEPSDTLQFDRDTDLYYDVKLGELANSPTTIALGVLMITDAVTEGIVA